MINNQMFLTHLVAIGIGHNRTSLPNTSCIFLQHPKLNPFLSKPSTNFGGLKDSKILNLITTHVQTTLKNYLNYLM